MTSEQSGSSSDSVRVLYVDVESPPSALTDAEAVTVSTVSTVAAARERLDPSEEPATRVDCVVSEYDLPESDGLTLLETARDDYSDLPFVVFTDSGDEMVASEAVGSGATDYLPKQAGGEQLCDRVRDAVATDAGRDSTDSGDWIRELTDAFPDAAFVFDEAGRYLDVLSGPETDRFRVAGTDTTDRIGKRLHDVFDSSQADRFLDHIRTTLETGSVETIAYCIETTAGERWFEGRTAPLEETIDGQRAVVWVARDVTERRESERKLARSRDEITRLNRINGLVNDILQSLAGSATREEIERTVCEGLANSEFYQFAWAGEPWVEDEQTSPTVVAGADREKVEALVEATSARSGERNAFTRVVRRDESVVVDGVSESEQISDEERARMLDLGISLATLVPLTYGDTNYGVLAIGGETNETFGDRELTALETLGEVVALAINAVKNRNLVFADTAIELEFRVRDSKSVFGRISDDLDCRCRLEGFVSVSEDRLLEYVGFEDADESRVRDALDDAEVVEEWRAVTDDDCVFEVVLAESGVHRLATTGTVVKSVVAEDGDVRYVAEAPSDVDVRTVVESFRQAYPDSELARKRERDRPVHTVQEFQRTLGEDLTDKQRTVLRAAYFAGYFEYPRESSGSEVAESLDIASATFHQHLQAAQRKLVGTFLDT